MKSTVQRSLTRSMDSSKWNDSWAFVSFEEGWLDVILDVDYGERGCRKAAQSLRESGIIDASRRAGEGVGHVHLTWPLEIFDSNLDGLGRGFREQY